MDSYSNRWCLTCNRVGGCGAGGGAGGADHAGVTAAGPAHSTGAGTAVAAPLPAISGAADPLPGAVLPDVVTHLMTTHGSERAAEYRLADLFIQSSQTLNSH